MLPPFALSSGGVWRTRIEEAPKIPVQSHQTSHKRAICGYASKKAMEPGGWAWKLWLKEVPRTGTTLSV